MKIEKEEFSKINNWIRINRDVIKNIYSSILNVCNNKYDLKLIDNKKLYFDLSIYLYYNVEDKYGITLFNSNEEKRNYKNSLNKPNNNNSLYYSINNEDYEKKSLNNNKQNNEDYEKKSLSNNKQNNIKCDEDLSDNDYDNFDECMDDKYYEELYNEFFCNDNPS